MKQNPYTQAAITRAIKAAMAAGLKVTAVKPDGTVLTESRENRSFAGDAALTNQPKLRDARDKLGAH